MSTATQTAPRPAPLSWNRIWTVVQKELVLALRNRMTQVTIGVVTIIFIMIPLGLAYGMGEHGFLQQLGSNRPIDEQELAVVRQAFPALAGLPAADLIQALLLSGIQSMFLIIPLMVPLVIAVYSIIGEKQTRSLEAVLATPIETSELLAGKCLAAAIPGIFSGWVSYALFVVLAIPALSGAIMGAVVLRPAWLLAMLLVAPASSFLAVILGLIISSRATDPQSAQQVAGVIVLPVVALMIGQITGLLQLSVLVVLIVAALFLALDAGLLLVAVRLFQRETILTRWK